MRCLFSFCLAFGVASTSMASIACSSASASAPDESDSTEVATSRAEAACIAVTSEEACLEAKCVWGDQGEGPTCFYVGDVDAQPGSGDPGGGGGRRLLRLPLLRRLAPLVR